MTDSKYFTTTKKGLYSMLKTYTVYMQFRIWNNYILVFAGGIHYYCSSHKHSMILISV